MSFTVRPLREEKPPRRSVVKPVAFWLLRLSGPLLAIGHMWREHQEKKRKEEQRVNLLKRVFIVLIATFCAVLLFAGTAKALVALKLISLQNIMNVAGSDLPVDSYGHTNILLLGQGDESHDGVDLTDTIMIASIDAEKTKSAVLLSLPRDLYFLETEKMGSDRVNSLYRNYKIALKNDGMTEEEASATAVRELANEIGKVLDIEIHHIVKVDFIGFVQAVDAIGGIDIVVPETLVDTEYPTADYKTETFTIEAGPQHIDGETALKYARSRHSTSDFARSARQQQIIKAIGDKVKAEGLLVRPGQIVDLLNIMQEHVETTLDMRGMVSLAGAGKELDQSKIISMQLNTANGLYGEFSEPGGLLYNPPRDQFGGAAVLLPVSIPEDPITWDRVRLLVRMMVHERMAYAEKAPIQIFNTGAPPGSARRLGGELIRFGFNVVAMENNPDDLEIASSRIRGNPDSPTALTLARTLPAMSFEALTQMMSSTSSSSVPSDLPPEPVTIELGSEYEYTPLKTSDIPFQR